MLHPQQRRAIAQGLRPVIQPRRVIPLHQNKIAKPPGNPLNQNVINWYYEHSYEPKYEQDDMSKMYPWIFGAQGLYGAMVSEECRYPCQVIDGVCVCPEK